MTTTIEEIPQTIFRKLFSEQNLRVAAYCRVSKKSGEQLSSLGNQIEYYTEYINNNSSWTLAGIYYDVTSGVRIKRRSGYKQLIKDCKKNRIDLIIVKSVSRFGRDALETIRQMRKLRNIGVGIYVEIGGFNTMVADNIVFESLALIAQEESAAKSRNIKFGIQQRMQNGRSMLNDSQFLGYTKDNDGKLIVVPQEAEVVRKIFKLYLKGYGCRKIKKYLEENVIKTATGKIEWSTSTIGRMLSNEKYVGKLLMQKTFTPDFIVGKRQKNNGELDMYLLNNSHEAIIDTETFEAVQLKKRHEK